MQQPFTYNKNVPHKNKEIQKILPMSALPVEGIPTFSKILDMRDDILNMGLIVYKQHIVRYRTKIIHNIEDTITRYHSNHLHSQNVIKEWKPIRQKVLSSMIVIPPSLYKYIIYSIAQLLSNNQINTLINTVKYPPKTIKSNNTMKSPTNKSAQSHNTIKSPHNKPIKSPHKNAMKRN